MKFFKRKDGKISDAQAYLRSTDNVSRPTAILMSIVGFLAVFAIVFSLVLGGRWVYDKLTDDSTGVKVAETSEPVGSVNDGSNPENDNDEGRSITVVNGSAGRIAENAANAVIDGGDEDAGKGVDDREDPVIPVVTTSELPNTGPADTALIILLAVVGGALAHNAYSRRRV